MPKQIYKIDQFHGGLNSNSDPRDIAENELADATDVMVDELGKIRTMGSNVAHDAPANSETGFTGTLIAGYGLFQFSHDRLEGNEAGDAAAETGDDYLALYDDDDQQIWIYSAVEGAWDDDDTLVESGVIDLGSTGSAKPAFYMMDGALRISDGAFGANNINQWYGYVKKTHFNIGNPYADVYDGWYDEVQSIASPTAGLVGSSTELLTGLSGTSDGTSLEVDDFCKVIGSDGTTETLITFVQMTDQQVLNVTDGKAAAITAVNNINSLEHADLGGGTTWATEDAFMIFPQAGAGFNVFVSVAEGTSSWDEGTYEVASTFIYDGDQESLPFTLASTFTITSSLNLPTFTVWAAKSYNTRITGARIYYREAGSPDYWKLLLDLSMRDGIRSGLLDSHVAWTAVTMPTLYWENTYATWEGLSEGTDEYWNNMATPSFHSTFTTAGTYLQAQQTVKTPDLINIYEILSGVSQEENTLDAKFITAVVANRLVYIGNVETKSENNVTEVFGDAMIKSPVNKVDMFPLSNMVEVSIRDGDEIVKLEIYADRLLQFKKKKLHIINISQAVEFLEDTHMHKGVLHPAAVCKTDFGIAWVNRQGCYLYNGESISNLLEKEGRQIIKESVWFDFTTDNSIIGYLPKKRQLIVLEDCTAASTGDIYLFDMVTRSWVKGNSKFIDSQIQTNFITDWNNDLVHVHTSGTATPAKWSDTSVASGTGTFSLETKDIDFGQPGVRKKIYKVYVSYKGDGTTVSVTYAINGDTDTVSIFYRINADGSTEGSYGDPTPFQTDPGTDDWVTAELKPVTPITNVYSFKVLFGGTAPADFEINDISIVYRMKSIK